MMSTVYALIHEEDGVFGISFPDFPGCISTGDTEDAVLRKGMQALALHVAGMIEDGDALPALRDLNQLRADSDFETDSQGAIIVLVPFETPGRSVRLNISMDENLLEAIDRAASAAGQSRSAFLAEAARRRLKEAA